MTLSVPRLLLSFLVAIAILPAVAQADSGLPQVPVPASDALTTAAHALAVAHWGVEPCAGQVTVTWAHMGAGHQRPLDVDELRHPQPGDLHPVRDQLQPGRRLGLAQALHGHRA